MVSDALLESLDMNHRALKKLGQNFLVNTDVAIAEAAHSYGMNVIELGPGYGILTRQLIKHAKKVVAVEKDTRLYTLLRTQIKSKKLTLINGDFFEVDVEKFGKPDIMISNIPYNLSSKTIDWLIQNRLQALLCLQKEFVEHMTAKENTDKYSRLSVMSRLLFSMTKIMDVRKGNFRPIPKVDSAIIYLKPKDIMISKNDAKMISLLMQHKKKTVRNALQDSRSYLKLEKESLRKIGDKISKNTVRVFKMNPDEILGTAREINSLIE